MPRLSIAHRLSWLGLIVVPALDLVIVMTGGNYNTSFPANELAIKYILPPIAGR